MLHNLLDSLTCFREHTHFFDVIGRMMPPSKDVHLPTSKTYDYAKLHGKEEFRLQMELRLVTS